MRNGIVQIFYFCCRYSGRGLRCSVLFVVIEWIMKILCVTIFDRRTLVLGQVKVTYGSRGISSFLVCIALWHHLIVLFVLCCGLLRKIIVDEITIIQMIWCYC